MHGISFVTNELKTLDTTLLYMFPPYFPFLGI